MVFSARMRWHRADSECALRAPASGWKFPAAVRRHSHSHSISRSLQRRALQAELAPPPFVPPTQLITMPLAPTVLWAQRADRLLLTIDLQSCKEPQIRWAEQQQQHRLWRRGRRGRAGGGGPLLARSLADGFTPVPRPSAASPTMQKPRRARFRSVATRTATPQVGEPPAGPACSSCRRRSAHGLLSPHRLLSPLPSSPLTHPTVPLSPPLLPLLLHHRPRRARLPAGPGAVRRD